MNRVLRPQDERGAVLVHAAVLLLALTAFSALVVDLGVMFVSRGQAQNAADAGALAAATSLAFVDSSDQALATNSAIDTAQQNQVWGEAPGVGGADVAFSPATPCPVGASTLRTCVRVNAFRTSYEGGGGNPLPTFFANLVGIGEQGTRATATAQVLASSGTADCVKPLAIPDKWMPWPAAEFDTATSTYVPPSATGSGTGYSLPADHGGPITLVHGTPLTPARPGAFYPVILAGGGSYQDALEGCSGASISPGNALVYDAAGSAGPAQTQAGVTTLINGDTGASWNPAANGGLGAPAGGCMTDGTCSRSPRLIAVALFDPAAYTAGLPGAATLTVTKIVGLWIESVAGGAVIGYLTPYPTVSQMGPLFNQESSFARTVVLIR